MRDRDRLPTWLERRGYSRCLKRVLAQRAARGRSAHRRAAAIVLPHEADADASAGGRSTRAPGAVIRPRAIGHGSGHGRFGGNVVPFPVRARAPAGG